MSASDRLAREPAAMSAKVMSAATAMRALKAALDPQNIFNPGKIVPAA